MAALKMTDKKKQRQALKNALNWYSFYINNWNPLIAKNDADIDEFFIKDGIPQMNTKPKTPRNIKTK